MLFSDQNKLMSENNSFWSYYNSSFLTVYKQTPSSSDYTVVCVFRSMHAGGQTKQACPTMPCIHLRGLLHKSAFLLNSYVVKYMHITYCYHSLKAGL